MADRVQLDRPRGRLVHYPQFATPLTWRFLDDFIAMMTIALGASPVLT
jgi:hypothetical protein